MNSLILPIQVLNLLTNSIKNPLQITVDSCCFFVFSSPCNMRVNYYLLNICLLSFQFLLLLCVFVIIHNVSSSHSFQHFWKRSLFFFRSFYSYLIVSVCLLLFVLYFKIIIIYYYCSCFCFKSFYLGDFLSGYD